MSKDRKIIPFTHFVVNNLNLNEFKVSVSKPSLIRYALETSTPMSETSIDRLTAERLLFISEAIHEKLERES